MQTKQLLFKLLQALRLSIWYAYKVLLSIGKTNHIKITMTPGWFWKSWNYFHLSLSAKNKPHYLYEFIWINTLLTVHLISFTDPNDKKNESTIVQIWLLGNNSSIPAQSIKWIIKNVAWIRCCTAVLLGWGRFLWFRGSLRHWLNCACWENVIFKRTKRCTQQLV